MASLTQSEARPELKRRSRRVKARVPIIVRAQKLERGKDPEKTVALIVNAHGALILLNMEVAVDEFVIVANPKNQKELLCRVTHLGPTFMGKAEIGIEFIRPSPEFWDIPEIPADWKQQEARKIPTRP